jgi:hypothetical protein
MARANPSCPSNPQLAASRCIPSASTNNWLRQNSKSTVSSKSTPGERTAPHSTQAPNTWTANTSTQAQTQRQDRRQARQPRTAIERGRHPGEAGDERWECGHLRRIACARRYYRYILVIESAILMVFDTRLYKTTTGLRRLSHFRRIRYPLLISFVS